MEHALNDGLLPRHASCLDSRDGRCHGELTVMRFCTQCAEPLERSIPEGEDRQRSWCTACGTVHYENPKVVAGCLVETASGGLLLCKRGIDPRRGFWTVPAGFLELGESVADGAVRETREETRANVQIVAPFAYLDLIEVGQLYVLFRATLDGAGYGPTTESLEVVDVSTSHIPWHALAFAVIRFALELYVEDRAQGAFRIHHGSVCRHPARPGFSGDDHRLQAHRAVRLAAGAIFESHRVSR